MGMTMSEKILAHAAGLAQVEAGQIVMAKVDKAMMDDLLGPRVEIAEQMCTGPIKTDNDKAPPIVG